MDVAVIVGDVILAGGGVGAAIVGRRAIRATNTAASEARDHAAAAAEVGAANRADLLALADENMTKRIRAEVTRFAEENPHVVGEAVLFDAMRDLLDAIISANLTDDDHPFGGRRRLHAARLPDVPADRR